MKSQPKWLNRFRVDRFCCLVAAETFSGRIHIPEIPFKPTCTAQAGGFIFLTKTYQKSFLSVLTRPRLSFY
jgi:hypothetical protein